MSIKYEDSEGIIIINPEFCNSLNEFRLDSLQIIENQVVFKYVSGVIKKFDLLEAFELGLIIEHPNCYCRLSGPHRRLTQLVGNFYIPHDTTFKKEEVKN